MADDGSKIVLLLEIDTGDSKAESEVFDDGEFRWSAAVARVDNNCIEYSVRCDDDVPFTCKAEVDVYRVDPADHKFGPFYWKNEANFNRESKRWARVTAQYNDPEYRANDKDRFQFHIHIISSTRDEPEAVVDPTKFATPNSRSDVILRIGDRQLHVSKELLAIYSLFFKNLFFGDYAEKGKEEVKLEDVVCEEFLDLLHVIYSNADITDRTVSHILKLADRFQIERLLDKSVNHLIDSTTFNLKEKLRFADQHKISDLRDYCLETCKYALVLQCFMRTSDYANFSDTMKSAIVERNRILVNTWNISDVKEGVITFLTHFRSSERRILFKFATPSSRSDIILKIGDQRFHVSKEFMAIHSPFFENLFFGEHAEKEKEEVELEDVVCEEFLDLLHVAYGYTEITDRTQLHILKLADRFRMERVLNKSEKYLKRCKGFNVMRKLLLADQYKLTGILRTTDSDYHQDHFHQRGDIVILKIGEEKLHASKKYLSLNSPVFNAMFFGGFVEKGKEEVELKDIDYKEFLDLLHVSAMNVEITDQMILHIMELADRFQMEGVQKLVTNHLKKSTGFDVVMKLRLADQYRLTGLLDHCLEKYSSASDITELQCTPEYETFSDAIKAAVCNRKTDLEDNEIDDEEDMEAMDYEDMIDMEGDGRYFRYGF